MTPQSVVLDGAGERAEVPFEQIVHVRVVDESGRNAVLLERRNGAPLTIAIAAHGGAADEMIGALLTLNALAARRRRIVVVAPLKPGARQAAAELLRSGPPFDPEQIDALQHHEVLLAGDDVIFAFEFSDDSGAFGTLVADPSLVLGATHWNELLAGPPRIAETMFSWSRSPELEDAMYLPTPGPGDSEGGDVY